jgi:hypothetical protein
VTLAEPGDRRVIRHLVCCDHAERDVLHARPFDPPRRALPARVVVQQQGDHHPGIVRRAPVTIRPIRAIECAEIKLLDRGQDEPREMILRQPVAQARRHQQDLLTLARQEVLGHQPIVLTGPDDVALRDSHVEKQECGTTFKYPVS